MSATDAEPLTLHTNGSTEWVRTAITAERLRIQTVRHDVFVQVDEHGTKAAAAAGGAMQATSMPMTTPVVVDHPFLFVITDTATGAPLFLGRVNDPNAQS